MRHRSLLILTTVLTTGALTLTACGSRDDSKNSSGGGDNQTVVIGVDAPLTGDLSALGLGIKNSADLAVKLANKNKTVPGVTFKIQPLDDQAQPSVGGQNAQKFIDNKDVLGVVGPLNSSVSQSMQKPLNDASLTQISPANTGTELTQGNDWKTGDKQRPFKTYFRTATTDQIQGAFAAKYLFNNAKIKNVYLIDDQKTYGAAISPPPSRRRSPSSAARSSAPTTSTPTTATSTPSSPRSRSPAPRPSTTAVNTPAGAP